MYCVNSIVYDVRTGTLLIKLNFLYSPVSYPNLTFGHVMFHACYGTDIWGLFCGFVLT